jgi:hypothetical protein
MHMVFVSNIQSAISKLTTGLGAPTGPAAPSTPVRTATSAAVNAIIAAVAAAEAFSAAGAKSTAPAASLSSGLAANPPPPSDAEMAALRAHRDDLEKQAAALHGQRAPLARVLTELDQVDAQVCAGAAQRSAAADAALLTARRDWRQQARVPELLKAALADKQAYAADVAAQARDLRAHAGTMPDPRYRAELEQLATNVEQTLRAATAQANALGKQLEMGAQTTAHN